jgi:CPA1 family monovalent cation:H+ antiporter
MDTLIIGLFSGMLLLGLACLLLPLATRLSLPYSVFLALLGMAVGGIASLQPDWGLPLPIADFLSGVRHFGLTGEVLLYIFLPSLLFAAGLSVDVRRLMDDVAPVLIMAILAVIVCTMVVGLALNVVFAVPLAVAALLGAVIATTDPAAVIAIFRDIGVPRRLQILVEGESLFNDAAAIALFTLLLGVLAGQATGSLTEIAYNMATDFLGGLLCGYLAARAVCVLLRFVNEYPVAEVTLTLCLAYGVYIMGDTYLGVSGVVATVTAALVVGTIGRTHMSAEGWSRLQALWHQIEFLASTLIFVLAATLIPKLLADVQPADFAMLSVVVVAALVARAAVLYLLLPLLSAARLAQHVSPAHTAVILWGGLRGAVTLAMALAVLENPHIPTEDAHQVAVLATAFVLFTLFVNAPTLRPLIHLLKLNQLTPLERVLRERSITVASASVQRNLYPIARAFGVEEGLQPSAAGGPGLIADIPASGQTALGQDDALKIGLITLAAQEEALYLQGYGDHTLSSRAIGRCVAQAGRLKDAAKTSGMAGYLQVANAGLQAAWGFRAALYLHNRLGLEAPLSWLLGFSFETMLVTRVTLKRLHTFTHHSIAPMLGADIEQAILKGLQIRLEGIDMAIRAFEMQYPGYALLLRASYVERAALRLEEAEYCQKRDDGLISPEVYRSLTDDMRQRRESIAHQPEMDMGMEVTDMIRKVPLFASMDERQVNFIARLLKPRLALPGETVVRKGDRGDAMYFIAAGSVEVVDTARKDPVVIEAGTFFGEIALIYNTPRTAEVRARGYCHLLVLYARDLERLLRRHPEIRPEIERAALARLNDRNT